MNLKKDRALFNIYAVMSLLFTALFIFEVPRIVFWAPVVLFVLYVAYNRVNREPFRFSVSAIVLCIFTVVFIIFNYDISQSFYYQTYIHIQAVFMFLMGYNFFGRERDFSCKMKQLDACFMAVSWFYIIYIAVTFVHYYFFTAADLEERFYYSIWYSFIKKPATVISMSLVIPFTYGVYSVFFSGRCKKLIGLLFIAITLGVNIFTETRTLVYLSPVVILAVFFVWIVLVRKRVKFGVAVCAVCGAVLFILAVVYKVFKPQLAQLFRDTVFERFFTYGIHSVDRWRFTKYVLDHFSLTYFGSGYNSAECGTPHNIWLYIYDYGGIVSFAVYCVFTVMLFVSYIRFLRNRSLGIEIKTLLSTVFAIMLVEYCLEPFILPLPSFYILTLFVFGLISGLSGFPVIKEEKS